MINYRKPSSVSDMLLGRLMGADEVVEGLTGDSFIV
jgi:hypothetical protein